MSESTAADLPQGNAGTLGGSASAILACVFQNEEQVVAAVSQLQHATGSACDLRVGARDTARAERIASQLGIHNDVDAADPLRGLGGLSTESVARKSVDRGGVLGAALGTVLGLALSFTPVATMMPVSRNSQTLALIIITFVVGTIIGSVLGAAFAPQSSSHAAFRLIDGMQDGGLALIVIVRRESGDATHSILESSGGTGLTRL